MAALPAGGSLEDAVRWVVTQQLDDLCWLDVFRELAHRVGVAFDPAMLPEDVMLRQCGRFVAALHAGLPYDTDKATLLAREHAEALALLQAAGLVEAGMTLPAAVRHTITHLRDVERLRELNDGRDY